MASLGALVIELAANTARLQGDLGKAVGMAEGAARRFNSIFRGVAALAGVGSLGAVALKAIEVGDELNKAAIKAGISGKSMSELAHAAKLADIDLGGLSNALRFMQKNLSEAGTGSKTANTALAALGLQLKDIQSLSADRQLEVLGDRINQLKDPADRARAATELFGRAGADLLPLFEQGAEGIRKAREEAQRLGVAFSNEQIKKLADVDDSIKRLRASWEGFAVSLISNVAPAISAVLDLLQGRAPGVDADPVKRRINQLKKDIADFESFDPSNVAERRRESASQRVAKELAAARFELQQLENIGAKGRASGARALFRNRGDPIGYAAAIAQEQELTEVIVTATKIRRDAMAEYYDELNERSMTSAERQISDLNRAQAELDILLADGIISWEQYRDRWNELIDGFIQPVEVTAKKIAHTMKVATDKMTEFTLEAARNMQDALAQFLFDPFEHGLKGMLKGFIDTIRRMVAEVAAAKIFDSIGGVGGVGKFLGGLLGFAGGGRPPVGRPSIVGEQGPELFVPGSAGTIIPNHKLGGTQVVQHISIDARGSSVESVKLLQSSIPAIIREAVSQSVMAMGDRLDRHGMRA